jgi:hypothetical protein
MSLELDVCGHGKKPENGWEIKDFCDGKCGIMMKLHIVKSKDMSEDDGDNVNHGTNMLLGLIKPWWNKVRCVICADSYPSHL